MSYYPGVIFLRADEYSDIDKFINDNKSKFKCTFTITSDVNDIYKLFNPNYHVLVTYKQKSYSIVDPIIHSFNSSRFNRKWIHKDDITDINLFNYNVNYCYISTVIDKRINFRPKFSIFTTCYKSYDYIDVAYNSIKKQSLTDWEWVILDDTPEDEHFNVLREKLGSDYRVRLYKRDKNSGNIGNVKNEVISLCRGKYVLEMDHDDEILPNCLSDAYNIFESDEKIGFVYGDTIIVDRKYKSFFYGDFLCKGYAGYYCEKMSNGIWTHVYNTPNVNNITMHYNYTMPNHPRMWRRSVLMECENYSELLPICDDFEIMLKTFCSDYKVVKNNKAQYIQYMNDGGNNFSSIRNSEINRISRDFLHPIFYEKYNVDQKMKEKGAFESDIYRKTSSMIWKRDSTYEHKRLNSVINLDYDKQYCIVNNKIYDETIKNLYKNPRNDFIFLSNELSLDEVKNVLETLGYDRMKCYSRKDCTEEQLVRFFKFLYANDNCRHYIFEKKNVELTITEKTKKRVFLIHNNKKGGVNKYVKDIIKLYPDFEYIFLENKAMMDSFIFENDVIFIQNFLNTDIKIQDVINIVEKQKIKMIIAIHDFIWLCQDQHNYSYKIPNSYLDNSIEILPEVRNLWSKANTIIMNSQFTYDIYSKYFDSSNFVLSPLPDYNIKAGIKNIPDIKDNKINLGVFSPLCKYKGERYVFYLKNKYKHINFCIVGQNIPYYNEEGFFDHLRKYNINGFLMLNEWGETYSYLLTKILNSGLPLLYNNFGALQERVPHDTEHYFKVFDSEQTENNTNFELLNTKFDEFIDYIQRNHGNSSPMHEDFSISSSYIYYDLFNDRQIPKIIFQTSKEKLHSNVKALINQYCSGWKYYHFTDKECIQFFRENPITEFPNIIEKFHSFSQGQHKADLFRYYYLYLRGGVFLDSDAMFETNIENIIQNYESVFAKSFMKNEHLFNGFIATYPRNEIIYNALKHAYNTDDNVLKSNYHYLCEELLRIVNNSTSEHDPREIIIYQEYPDAVNGRKVGKFKNQNQETLFIHYWQDRRIPPTLSYNKKYITPISKKIGLFNSFPFHYECFGFILNYAKNNNFDIDLYTNMDKDMGWLKFYKSLYSNLNLIDYRKFTGNTSDYYVFFLPTDRDFAFKKDWVSENTICINHNYKLRNPIFKHYLNIGRFKDSLFDFCYPVYPITSIANKSQFLASSSVLNYIEICIVGGGYGLNFSLINRFYSTAKIKVNIFVRNTEQINIRDMDMVDKTRYEISFKVGADTTELINTLNRSSYVLVNYTNNHAINNGHSCSGSIQMALNTLCRPIISKGSNKYLQIKNALEFDIESNENINLKDQIDLKSLEAERNKYVEKFQNYIKCIKSPKKSIYEINSDCNIPKKIFQTWEHSNIEPEFQMIIDRWKDFNPDYEYIFHDANERVEFLKNHFDSNVLNAYNRIVPGAYKADLWRYCVIYIYGGFYVDIDTLCLGKLDDLTTKNIEFIATIDLNLNKHEGEHNLACGFFGSIPKSKILLNAINRIVSNVENNIIPPSKLDFSGPGLLGRSVNSYLNREETSSFIGKEGIQNKINFLHFEVDTEYIIDTSTKTKLLQNKNKNQNIIDLYEAECNKIKNFTSYSISNTVLRPS